MRPGRHEEHTGSILYVHGPAGIGKTALLHRFAATARDAGRHVVLIDAAETASVSRTRDRIAEATQSAGSVVLVDNTDAHPGTMRQLADTLADCLPEDAVTVLAGRCAPGPRWLGEAGWQGLVAALPLGPLTHKEAEETLTALGLTEDLRTSVARFGHGHPLALALGAAAAHAGAFRDGEAPQELILQLLDHVIGDIPSPAHRAALEISAHSRWTTEDLLRSVLPEHPHIADIFHWLRRRPFVVSERHGVAPCPLVRELVDADVSWRDPSGYRNRHQRIRAHLLEQMRHTPPDGIPQAALALTYLHRRNGFVSRFVTWTTDPHLREVPYRPELREELLRFIDITEGSAASETAAHWLLAQPRAFRLYWDTQRQEPVGALAWLPFDATCLKDIARDPLATAAWQHAQATRPLRPHEHVVLARLYGAAPLCSGASPLLDLMTHRVLASFILREPAAWSYVSLASGTFLDPLMRSVDQCPLPEPVVTDRASFTLYAHDWRAVRLDRWTEAGHLAELSGPDARPTARKRKEPASPTVLTRAEFDAAVADALSAWQRKDLLAGNPLLRTRMITERGAGDAVEALRDVLAQALDTLGGDPRMETGLLRGAPTREAAAERLGLPLSTFRRHLTRGVDEIRAYLWRTELREP
jgi:hypothetical protein